MNRQQRIAVARTRVSTKPTSGSAPPPAPTEAEPNALEQLFELLSQEREIDCTANQHDPEPIRASTSSMALGHFCRICRVPCDENGLAAVTSEST